MTDEKAAENQTVTAPAEPKNLWAPAKPLSLLGSLIFLGAFAGACLQTKFARNDATPHVLAFILACYGITRILVDSKITQPLRQLVGKIPLVGKHLYGGPHEGLLSCSLCAGTWVGLALTYGGLRILEGTNPLVYALNAVIGGAVAYIVTVIVDTVEAWHDCIVGGE